MPFKTSGLTQTQYEINRNIRANIREYLGHFIPNISISDINSIKFQASLIAMVTAQSDELTRNLAVSAFLFNRFILLYDLYFIRLYQ